ncbi:MAG: ABC transporter substrate-binding protein [Myxococcales bacterium]
MKLAPAIVSLAALVAAAPAVVAADPVKIGLVAEFSGPFAAYGKQIENGMKAYLKAHGDTVAGRKIEILERDTTGPAPEVAKRVAQDLVTNDKIDFLAGFGLSPNAFAVAAVATQAKTPMVIMNAASSMITTKSPYVVRFSMTLPQVTEPIALWAAKNGIKKVYSIVSDYAPGIDAEGAFEKAFTSHGGTIAGSVRVPLKNPDFAPFVQRAKDAKPEAVFIFVPAGEQSVAFVKAFAERGLREAGIKIIGPGDVVDDDVLESMGAPTLGIITTHHYSFAHESPENDAFRKAYAAVSGDGARPNFMAVGGYDGMAAIAETVQKLGGKLDADKAMEILKNYKSESPRGPIQIDPQTRDIVQTVYVRRVEQKNGHFYNVEFDKFPGVKDPVKEASATKEAAK